MSADPADPADPGSTCGECGFVSHTHTHRPTRFFSGPDLSHVVPETELLDNSLQKGRAQLSITVHKHRVSKSRCHDNTRSREGDSSLGTRVRPLGPGSRLKDVSSLLELEPKSQTSSVLRPSNWVSKT